MPQAKRQRTHITKLVGNTSPKSNKDEDGSSDAAGASGTGLRSGQRCGRLMLELRYAGRRSDDIVECHGAQLDNETAADTLRVSNIVIAPTTTVITLISNHHQDLLTRFQTCFWADTPFMAVSAVRQPTRFAIGCPEESNVCLMTRVSRASVLYLNPNV